MVTSYAEVGIEIILSSRTLPPCPVTSYAEVGIEIVYLQVSASHLSVTSYTEVMIKIGKKNIWIKDGISPI